MNNVSPVKAIGFGFSSFFKNFFFFLYVFFVGVVILSSGFLVSLIIGLPFLLPLFMMGGRLFSFFVSISGKTDPQVIALQLKSFVDVLISGGILSIVGLVFGIILVLILNKMTFDYVVFGLTRISIDIYDKGRSSIGKLFSPFAMFFKYFISTLLYNSILWVSIFFVFLLGFFLAALMGACVGPLGGAIGACLGVLGVIPFIYWVIKFWFYSYLIADKNFGTIDAFKKSYNIKGGFKAVFLTNLLFFILFAFLGMVYYIPHIGGILNLVLSVMTWPIFILSGAFLYRHLTGE